MSAGIQPRRTTASLGCCSCWLYSAPSSMYEASMALSSSVAAPESKRFDGTRGGFLLGLTVALSSPWNIAFWLAVIGRQAQKSLTFTASIVFALAVVLAAATWGLFLCSAVRLGARFATPQWEIVTQGLTGLLMLFFAGQLALRIFAG